MIIQASREKSRQNERFSLSVEFNEAQKEKKPPQKVSVWLLIAVLGAGVVNRVPDLVGIVIGLMTK